MSKNRTNTPATPVVPQDLRTPYTPGPVGMSRVYTKQEIRDLYLRNQRQVKLAAKVTQKQVTTAKRLDGVIGTIKQCLLSGTTKQECLDTLTQKFPTRDPLGMVVTVGIQFSRLVKSTGGTVTKVKVEGRGNVYTLTLPAVVTPAAA